MKGENVFKGRKGGREEEEGKWGKVEECVEKQVSKRMTSDAGA
jgi:hypothetical protein